MKKLAAAVAIASTYSPVPRRRRAISATRIVVHGVSAPCCREDEGEELVGAVEERHREACAGGFPRAPGASGDSGSPP
jgi:hypothetical protein